MSLSTRLASRANSQHHTRRRRHPATKLPSRHLTHLHSLTHSLTLPPTYTEQPFKAQVTMSAFHSAVSSDAFSTTAMARDLTPDLTDDNHHPQHPLDFESPGDGTHRREVLHCPHLRLQHYRTRVLQVCPLQGARLWHCRRRRHCQDPAGTLLADACCPASTLAHTPRSSRLSRRTRLAASHYQPT